MPRLRAAPGAFLRGLGARELGLGPGEAEPLGNRRTSPVWTEMDETALNGSQANFIVASPSLV